MRVEELLKSNVILNQFFDSSDLAMGILDHHGNWIYLNSSHLKLLNYHKTELLGQHFLKHSHPECQDHYYNLVEEVNTATFGSITVEKRFIPKNGSIAWVKFSITKIFLNSFSKDPVFFCQSIDISEYKRIQEVSISSNANSIDINLNDIKFEKISSEFDRISKILDTLINADINTMIIAADIENNVIFFNKGAEKKLGYKAEEVVGKVQPIIFHDIEEVNSRMEELYRIQGKYYLGGDMVIEYNKINKMGNNEWTYIRKDGSKLPVHLVITPVQDNEGLTIGFVGVITEITEIKKYQTKLEQTNKELEFYNSFFTKMGSLTPSTVYVYNIKEGKNVYNNDAITTISGYTPAEIQEMGENFIPTIVVQENLDQTQERFKKLKTITDDEVVYHDYKIKHKNGNLKWIYSAEKAFSRDPDGNVIEIIGVGSDITEIKKYQSDLEEKNKELEQFVYIASHDLQEPLRTVSSYTALLLEQNKSRFSEVELQCAKFIEESVVRMKNQIKHLLNYSRLGLNSQFEIVDLNEIIKEITTDLALVIKENSAIIHYNHLPILKALRTEMRMLLQNLIQNAIKFKYKGRDPIIEISAIERETDFEISVKDNGIGINPKFFDRIFLIFQQLDTEELKNGHGIGLANSKKIVILHNGKIWLESKENIGTTFYFTISK